MLIGNNFHLKPASEVNSAKETFRATFLQAKFSHEGERLHGMSQHHVDMNLSNPG